MAEVPEPRPGKGELLVRVVECGICGTDRDIVRGDYGTSPPDRSELILGHENLGRVESVPAGTTRFAVGDWVVATVRRSCGICPFCDAGRSDVCSSGRFTERGIRGRDGFLADRYSELPEYMIRVPPRLRDSAVLLEPMSVVEKAVHGGLHVLARRGRIPAGPGSEAGAALVTGTGAVGILAALLLRLRGYSVTTVDRHDDRTAAARIVADLGARHVDVAAGLAPVEGERYDLILEASGSVLLDLELPKLLAPNGVLVLTGIPPTDRQYPVVVGGTRLRAMVLENQAVVGSVNANRTHFEAALRDLGRASKRFGTLVDRIIGPRVPWERFEPALGGPSASSVKSVLTVAAG